MVCRAEYDSHVALFAWFGCCSVRIHVGRSVGSWTGCVVAFCCSPCVALYANFDELVQGESREWASRLVGLFGRVPLGGVVHWRVFHIFRNHLSHQSRKGSRPIANDGHAWSISLNDARQSGTRIGRGLDRPLIFLELDAVCPGAVGEAWRRQSPMPLSRQLVHRRKSS